MKIMDIAVMVPDAKKAAAWYRDVLGFKIHSQDGHWVTVGPESAETVIHLCEGEVEPGNTGIGLSAKDLQKTYSELKSKGVEFTQPPADHGFGPYARFKDPYGNEFWLFPE